MTKTKIGLIQMRVGADRKKNLARALEMIGEAARKGADIVCLPELFGSRYFPQHRGAQKIAEPIPGPTTDALSLAAKQNKVVIVGGSIYERSQGKFYNTSVVFDQNGRILGKYRKVHIPFDSHYYEKDYFSSGKGYKAFNTKFGKLSVLICFDQWYPEPARISRLMHAEMLFYPTAIGTVKGMRQAEGDWQEAWENVQRGHAISNSMVICTVNRVGIEEELNFWGGSFVIDQFGKTLFRAGNKEGVFVVACDLSLGRNVERGWGFIRNRKADTYGGISH
jgi:agmatine deiminase